MVEGEGICVVLAALAVWFFIAIFAVVLLAGSDRCGATVSNICVNKEVTIYEHNR